MIDALLLAAGAVVFLVGQAVGFALGRFWRKRATSGSAPVSPAMCGCGHGLEHHDPDTNECHGSVEIKNYYDKRGYNRGTQRVPCSCRRYVGPQPVEDLFALPYLPPSDDAA